MRNKAEEYAIGGVEHQENFSSIKEAFQYMDKAKGLSQISLEDFTEVYDPKAMMADISEAKRLKLKFEKDDTLEEKERRREAKLLEVVFAEQCSQANWLGPEISMYLTHPYDDYCNGTDMIGEVVSEDSVTHLALSVDATIGSGEVWKKLSRLMEKIRDHKLTSVRYFHSDVTGYAGPLTEIPHIILGIGRAQLNELARIWVESKKGIAGSNKKLEMSPVRGMILHEAHAQITALKHYAETVGNTHAAELYGNAYRIVQGAIDEASASGYIVEDNYDDDVFNQILNYSEHGIFKAEI